MTSNVFAAAYSKGIKRTLSFLIARGVPRDTAEDVAQAGWSRGWEKLEQLRDDAMVVPWINTIALNDYRRSVRKLHWEQSWKPVYQDLAPTFVDCAAIEVTRILESCNPADRRLLQAQMSGATAGELAEEAGVTDAAMRIRLHRARRKARARCQPQSPPNVGQTAA